MKMIRLDLRHHCIETEIRHQYNRRLAQLMGPSRGDPVLENQLEILLRALETLDFGYLRARYTVFSGGQDADVGLDAGNCGVVEVYLNGKIVTTRSRRRPKIG